MNFMDYDLGYFDRETPVLEPPENPFPKVVPMWPERSVTYVSGTDSIGAEFPVLSLRHMNLSQTFREEGRSGTPAAARASSVASW